MSFQSIPILDLSLAQDPATKGEFLQSLRFALLEVGFLYIKNTGLEDGLIKEVIAEGTGFFDIPMENKLEIEMKNAPSFLGPSALAGH
jgi:isopenicillin N synthase-like dioxygenase